MKKTEKRLISLLLCSLLLAPTLTACKSAAEDTEGGISKPPAEESITTQAPSHDQSAPQDTPSTSQNATNDINVDTYKEQISYYMELAESLNSEILKLKEEAYIDACEYQLKISTLEDTVEMLKKTVASLSNGNSPTIDTKLPQNDRLNTKSDYKYTTENGAVTINAYIGSAIDVNVPATIDGLPVVAIGEEAFKATQIRSVTIPSGVKEIGWFAFSACTVLESVTIPSSVTSVGYGAFDYCPKSMKIICEKNSYIEAYAKSWGMSVSAK